MYSFARSLVCSLARSFARSFVCSVARVFVNSYIGWIQIRSLADVDRCGATGRTRVETDVDDPDVEASKVRLFEKKANMYEL